MKLRARSPSARVGAASRDAGFLLFERARSVLGEGGGNPYTVSKSAARKFKIWKRTGKLWQKKPKKKITLGKSQNYVGSLVVAMYAFGFQECTTKLFGSPDSDASPHLSLALAFPLPRERRSSPA